MSLLIRVFKLDAVKRNSELVSDHVKHGLENLLLDFESPFLVIKREKKKIPFFRLFILLILLWSISPLEEMNV